MAQKRALDQVEGRDIDGDDFYSVHVQVGKNVLGRAHAGNAHERHDEHDQRKDEDQARAADIQNPYQQTAGIFFLLRGLDGRALRCGNAAAEGFA